MALKDKLISEGMKLASSPRVARLAQDERVMKLLMQALSVPGRVSTFTAEQKEAFAKTMGLASADEVRDLRRTVAALEQALRRLQDKTGSGA